MARSFSLRSRSWIWPFSLLQCFHVSGWSCARFDRTHCGWGQSHLGRNKRNPNGFDRFTVYLRFPIDRHRLLMMLIGSIMGLHVACHFRWCLFFCGKWFPYFYRLKTWEFLHPHRIRTSQRNYQQLPGAPTWPRCTKISVRFLGCLVWFGFQLYLFDFIWVILSPKTNITPENRRCQKETSLLTMNFQVNCQFQGVYFM